MQKVKTSVFLQRFETHGLERRKIYFGKTPDSHEKNSFTICSLSSACRNGIGPNGYYSR
ncbi:MAG: hypothetical protein IPN33_15265 [Saprospiraceae bacterium]|nr:hypothetical protein [Saprospiraceae bacterium]